MTSLAFVVPVHRRFNLTRVCLRQLRRTCDALREHGIEATAVVMGDDANLATAHKCGFTTIEQENEPLGRKLNDGYEYAASPEYLGCEYVIPFGSDDWIDPALVARHITRLSGDVIGAHRLCTLVDEAGEWMAPLRIPYPGGDGIRLLPASLLEPVAYRPVEEDRHRALDTSAWIRLKAHCTLVFDYFDLDALQIVEFKSRDEQLNPYAGSLVYGNDHQHSSWDALAERYGVEAVSEARDVLSSRLVAA